MSVLVQKCLTCYMFACCKHVALPVRLAGAGVFVCYLLAKPCVSILLLPLTATLQNVGGGVGMFDSALAFGRVALGWVPARATNPK